MHATMPSSGQRLSDILPGNAPTFRGRRRRGIVSILIETILRWADLARQRRALRTLDDRMLKDIGISRADVEAEASKPFWTV